jgi:outer membrane lipoprotein-sorting protein
VRIFRQLSTPRLLGLLAAVVAVGIGMSVAAMAALGSSSPTPAAKPLDQALQDAAGAARPSGVTARVKFTNNLFPSGSLSGIAGNQASALQSSATGRLWWRSDGQGRIELQSDAGDTQILWNHDGVTVYDNSSNTVYKLPVSIPSHDANDTKSPPSLAEIDKFLKSLAEHWTLSDAIPSDVAGQPAYTVRISPAHSAGLLGALQLAWDANQGVPLEIGVYAQGQSSPVLGLSVTDISYGDVSTGDVAITPPANAKTVDLGANGRNDSGSKNDSGQQAVTGLAAVQAQLPFTVSAPAELVGLPLQTVRLIGGSEKGALVLYGQGLGAVAVVEREAKSGGNDQFSQLPKVSIGSATGHELATQLGTIISFGKDGVSYLVAGSMPASAAETAARQLG